MSMGKDGIFLRKKVRPYKGPREKREVEKAKEILTYAWGKRINPDAVLTPFLRQ